MENKKAFSFNDLDFVNEILGDRKIQYRKASWLGSPFNAEILRIPDQSYH
ncbi:MAG: hypothetical protein ACHQYP_12105 [Nitrospiria bacterium]